MAIRGDGKVEAIEIVRNELYRDAGGALRARSTEQHETIDCGLVLRSIGYRGVPLPGVPFDETHARDPERGRPRARSARRSSTSPASTRSAGSSAGPSGVIGTNKRDAQETVDFLIEDLHEGRLNEPPTPAASRSRRCWPSASPTS